jgi:hypothetical protein
MLARADAAPLHVCLLERRQPALRVLPDRFDEGELRAAGLAAQLDAVAVLAPFGHVGHQIDAEGAARRDDARDRRERRRQIARPDQRLEDAVRRDHHRERLSPNGS